MEVLEVMARGGGNLGRLWIQSGDLVGTQAAITNVMSAPGVPLFLRRRGKKATQTGEHAVG